MKTLKRAVELSHQLISEILNNGDIAVDCTAGNGSDTLFLAQSVGDEGYVYSFDIQEIAVNNTREKLKTQGLEKRVLLINDNHNYIEKYIDRSIKTAMYNLGYLPGGNHNLVTNPQSTINSLQKILDILELGGIVTIAIYYGHPGGVEEKEAVIEFATKLDQDIFAVQKIEFINFKNEPPILICIERIK